MKPLVYLAGPIDGCTAEEARGWRDIAHEALGSTLDPTLWGEDSIDNIVELDKAAIDRSDIVLANCWKIGVGTSMEIIYAWGKGKPCIVVVPAGKPVSPWIRYHATVVVETLNHALEILQGEAA